MQPKQLTTDRQREMLRHDRDAQWAFMERIKSSGTLWWCIWNKHGLPEKQDEMRSCLLSGMNLNQWIHAHPDWFDKGEWDEARYAMPVRLTEAGLEALRNRHLYDMEPVVGGLMEPGFIGIPKPREGEDDGH